MFDARAHIGWTDQCESALRLTQFDQTHTDNSTNDITSIIDQLNLHQLTRTRGRSAACFGGFRMLERGRHARVARCTWLWAHMEKDREPAVDAITTWFSSMVDTMSARAW